MSFVIRKSRSLLERPKQQTVKKVKKKLTPKDEEYDPIKDLLSSDEDEEDFLRAEEEEEEFEEQKVATAKEYKDGFVIREQPTLDNVKKDNRPTDSFAVRVTAKSRQDFM